MKSIQKCLGTNIRTFRKKLGITQAVLAERTDLSISTIQQLEGGYVWLGLDTVAVLSTALGIDEAWLFQDSDAVRMAAASVADHPLEECVSRIQKFVIGARPATQALAGIPADIAEALLADPGSHEYVRAALQIPHVHPDAKPLVTPDEYDFEEDEDEISHSSESKTGLRKKSG